MRPPKKQENARLWMRVSSEISHREAIDAILKEIQDAVPKVSEDELKDTSKRRIPLEKEKIESVHKPQRVMPVHSLQSPLLFFLITGVPDSFYPLYTYTKIRHELSEFQGYDR